MRLVEASIVLALLWASGNPASAQAEEPAVAQPTDPAEGVEPGQPARPEAASALPPPARPPPLADEPILLPELPREPHVEVNASFALVSRLTSEVDGIPSGVGYGPGPGFAVSARIVAHPYLRLGVGLTWAQHAISYEPGALGQGPSLGRGPRFESKSLVAYSLDARVLPTFPLDERVRLWLVASVGWGTLGFPVARGVDSDALIRDRNASFVEFPLGVGALWEVLPGWLSIDFEALAAPTLSSSGTAHVPVGAIDASGQATTVGALPRVPISFVQTLGLSVLL